MAPSARFSGAFSHVDTLTIVHSDAARFLHLLCAQQGSTEGDAPIMFLPRLQTLTILDDASDEVLPSVVGDRATLGHSLQRLTVHAGVRERALLELSPTVAQARRHLLPIPKPLTIEYVYGTPVS